jgi:hypothetical protein
MKQIFSVLCLLFLAKYSYCQSIKKHGIAVSALINHTKVNGDNIYGLNHQTGGFSINYIYQYNNSIRLVTGIDYLQKGGKTNIEFYNITGDVIGNFEQRLYLNYLQTPISIRFEPLVLGSKNGLKQLHAIFGVGAYGSLLVNAFVNPQYINLSHNVTKLYNSLDWGSYLQTGLTLRLNPNYELQTNVIYSNGFSNIQKNNSGTNQSFSLQFGINYFFVKKVVPQEIFQPEIIN